ncbi:hypothetical protein [Haloarchaeobius sp. DFWS5]|uniref:hypothetical protein n=1 Tax=Haloarchaeobius sp. DFWS5 TaxID=3446114 RepID=UPI003EBE769C
MATVPAVLLLVAGVACAVRPRTLARLEERMDPVGSDWCWENPQPTPRKVKITRALGVVASVAAVGWLTLG